MMKQREETTTGTAGTLRAERRAGATWTGTLFEGSGTVSAGSHAFAQLPITWASRTERPEGRTSPEELLAAAHAGCFSMALSLVLAEAGTPADALTVDAVCVFEQVPTGFAITTIALDVHGRVAGIDDDCFEQAAQRAAQICPVSNALRGNVDIGLNVRLDP
jgi:osmotically inducible protein OsmC